MGFIVVALFVCAAVGLAKLAIPSPRIDRQALVSRHNVVLTAYDGNAPLQVGNGEFAFGMDITGLQTFAPFNTMSQWGWHTSALPPGQKLSDFKGQVWDTHGRPVRYMMPDPAHPELSDWMAANPHRIDLGRLAMLLTKKDGSPAVVGDLTETRQELDLWHGIVTSHFELEGDPVTVTTACHPKLDSIAVRIVSPLIREGRLSVCLSCPGNDPLEFANFVGDWTHPGTFEEESPQKGNRLNLVRKLDNDPYFVALGWSAGAHAQNSPEHGITVIPDGNAGELSVTCTYSKSPSPEHLPDAEATIAASSKQWPEFWKSGGAIDFSGSTDPRWMELERRVVLSQYLMRVNESGSLPPQESGLVNNGWFGKFHLEMTIWHEAQWGLWNRWPEIEGSMGIYPKLLSSAEKRAADQGYRGARWPKAIGPNGEEWPNIIHGTLIWQQPHPIFFAELDYRAHPTRKTLEKWWPVVSATADFMASYAFFDAKTQRYVLGPPLTVVSENTDPKVTEDPTFELSYWRFGLRVAQEWRSRLGMKPSSEWGKVLRGLAPLPVENGVYVLYEGVQDMWTKFNFEHPAIVGAYGLLPGDGVDVPTMRRSLAKIASTWNFDRTWGWDFPMLAMCAARLGEPKQAVDYLLTSASGFQFDARGLATGGPFPYFPSNGALLYAVAMMAGGWDGAPKGNAPGFPAGWHVRSEGLGRAF